jgi:hypothetical protein
VETSVTELRRLTRRAWGIMFFGLLILPPILQPANVFFALSTLSKAKTLPTREPSIETQLWLIVLCSSVFSVLFWGLFLRTFDLI